MTAYGQAVANSKESVLPDSAARMARLQKSIEKLKNDLKNASNDGKSPGTIHFLIGMDEVGLKRYSDAVKEFSLAIKLNREMKQAYLYRGAAYEMLRNYELAISDYKNCLPDFKDNAQTSARLYSGIGKLQGMLKKYEDAVQSESIAISLVPFFSEAYVIRAYAYGGLHKYDLAILDFTTAIGGYQNDDKKLAGIFYARAEAKRYSKKYKDAINDYSEAIRLNPTNKLAYWNLAATYNNNGDYQLADKYYTKAIDFYKGDNKNLSRLYDDRALMEMGEQKFMQAIKDDSLAISYDDKYGLAYWNRANAYSQNADFQLSIDSYRQTMNYYQQNNGALAQLFNNIADSEYFLGDYQKVIDCSTSSIDLNPKQWSSYLNRGRAYLKKNNKELAMGDFNKVLELDTTKSSFAYAFALFYTGNPDKAIDVMRKNVIATTNDPLLMSHYYNIACLYSLMNKPEEANIYLKKCIDDGYSKKYALADPDLENIRNTQEYKDMTK
jgi:tetratricopeptide (TPR) repeat protein